MDIEKCSGNQKFCLAGCEKMAMKETIVSLMRFGLVFDNVLWSEPVVSLLVTVISIAQGCGDLLSTHDQLTISLLLCYTYCI